MSPPPCRRLGRHCRTLDVTVRITTVDADEDHDATWLLGHTERIEFGPIFEREGELWCKARIHVACRFLATGDDSRPSRCTAHGYQGRIAPASYAPAARRLGGNRFAVVERRRLMGRHLPPPAASKRSLPIATNANPCATAPCTTSDHKRGAACCRDIQLDVCCSTKQPLLESLIRHRKAPYLCKTERENDEQVVVEIISACGYLTEEGSCDLHGRIRADARPAKPIMCSQWPEKRSGLHAGCAFKNRRLKL